MLGCSGGSAPGRSPSCYLLDRGVAIDAGALASALTLEEQNDVSDVFVSHAHWDHVRDLPLTLINRRPGAPALRVHALEATVATIRRHLMNGEVWFDAFDLPTAESPVITALPLTEGEARECAGYRITAISMPHTVPAVGFHIDDGSTAIVVCGDTGGGQVLRGLPQGGSPLRAVFIEASFPNRMEEFARLTGHLTPALLGRECADLAPDVEVLVTHMKPGFETELVREVNDLARLGVRPCRDGDVLEF